MSIICVIVVIATLVGTLLFMCVTQSTKHTFLSILKRVMARDRCISKTQVDITTYQFQYGGYDQDDMWYKTLVEILDGHGKVRLIGGEPNDERLKDLKKLSNKGAEIRFLKEPPTAHLSIYSLKHTPAFIWFEGKHKDGKARCVVYAMHPSKEDQEMAIAYYSEAWDTGTPIKEKLRHVRSQLL